MGPPPGRSLGTTRSGDRPDHEDVDDEDEDDDDDDNDDDDDDDDDDHDEVDDEDNNDYDYEGVRREIKKRRMGTDAEKIDK